MSNSGITVGNVQIVGIADARADYPWPLSELFPDVPPGAWPAFRERYPDVFGGPETWRSDFGCYLVRSEGRTILIDTGVGDASAPMASAFQIAGSLLSGLKRHGCEPEDVHTVVLTHLHPDHTGWTVRTGGGSTRLTFPNARYVVHEADWEAFHRPDVQASFPFPYVDEFITPLETLGALERTDGRHSLTGELSLIHTPGHTPGHMSILVASAGERAVILGDVAVHPAQVTEPSWNVMFDMLQETARATRRAMLDRIEAEGMTVAACHFPEPGYGRLVRIDGRRYWEPLSLNPS